MPIFYYFRDLTIYWSKFYVFLPFLHISISFEATARVYCQELGARYQSWSRKLVS